MALYVHQQATLGSIEGSGYLFRQQSAVGETYRGVFFGQDGASVSLETLVDVADVTFCGVLYKKTLSGKISSQQVELPVEVKGFREVSMGEKVILEVLET